MTTPLEVQRVAEGTRAAIGRALVGLDDTVSLLLAALFADGHVLLEEVPGTGKTTLAKALSKCLSLDFARIQFTPDLLPSDITGLYWYNQREGDFEFRSGPVFANVVLADEINRATPRTQSALLEAMQERQVTVEGDTRLLPQPFFVMATQNPIELEGTFPLPEAQIDRFLMRLRLGYPTKEGEHEILLRHAEGDPLGSVSEVSGLASIADLREAVRGVRVSEPVRGYIVQLARTTREHASIELGVSPRGTLFLYRSAQSFAALAGRDYVLPDDVKAVAPAVLAHRVMLDPTFRLRGSSAEDVVKELLEAVPVPVEE